MKIFTLTPFNKKSINKNQKNIMSQIVNSSGRVMSSEVRNSSRSTPTNPLVIGVVIVIVIAAVSAMTGSQAKCEANPTACAKAEAAIYTDEASLRLDVSDALMESATAKEVSKKKDQNVTDARARLNKFNK